MSLITRLQRAASLAGLVSVLVLPGACANIPGDTVCPERGPNTGSWPYCAPSEPGGGGPGRDDRINPSGGRN